MTNTIASPNCRVLRDGDTAVLGELHRVASDIEKNLAKPRAASPLSCDGTSSAMYVASAMPLPWARVARSSAISSTSGASENGAGVSSSLPASIFEKSRIPRSASAAFRGRLGGARIGPSARASAAYQAAARSCRACR